MFSRLIYNPCPSFRYEIMRDCWSYVANERPEFSQLVSKLDRILTVTANEVKQSNYSIKSIKTN